MLRCLTPASTRRSSAAPRWPAAAVLACLSLGLPLSAQPETATATASDAVALIADSTIDFSGGGHVFFEYFAPDGTSRGSQGHGDSRSGTWYVRQDDTVCFIHADPHQSGCVFIRVADSSIEFQRIDGVVEGPFGYVRGNPKGL